MNHEIMMYAIAQKEGLGLDKAVEECSASMPATTATALLLTLAPLRAAEYRMSRYGVTPNMMVIPPQLALYMSLAPEEKISYAVAGPKADATFEAGAAGFTARGFRGCGIFTSEPFEVSDDQVRSPSPRALCPPSAAHRRARGLGRTRSRCSRGRARSASVRRRRLRTTAACAVADSPQPRAVYVMMPPQTEPRDGDGRHTADLLIYDEESDKHVRISWDDAVEATMIGDRGDDYATADGKGKICVTTAAGTDINLANGMTLEEWRKAAEDVSAYNKGKVGATPAQPYSSMDAKALACRIVLARPFIEHLMHSAILAVSGRSTGATCAISQLERRPCDRRRPWLFPRAQCSGRATCS